MSEKYCTSACSSDSEEVDEYNADLILSRLKIIGQTESIGSGNQTKLPGSEKCCQSEICENIFEGAVDINNLEIEANRITGLEQRDSENYGHEDAMNYYYENYLDQFENYTKYAKSETGSDYTDPHSEESVLEGSMDFSSSFEDVDVLNLKDTTTFNEKNYKNVGNSFKGAGDYRAAGGEDIPVSRQSEDGERYCGGVMEGMLASSGYDACSGCSEYSRTNSEGCGEGYWVGQSKSMDTNIKPDECRSNGLKCGSERNSLTIGSEDDDYDGSMECRKERTLKDGGARSKGGVVRKEAFTKEEEVEAYTRLGRSRSDDELEALEEELEEAEGNGADTSGRRLDWWKTGAGYECTSQSLRTGCDSTDYSSDTSEVSVRVTARGECLANQRGVAEEEEEQRRRDLEVRMMELQEDLIRLRKELKEAKEKKKEEKEKIAEARRRMESVTVVELKTKHASVNLSRTEDLRSRQDSAVGDLRKKTASEYQKKLEHVEVLCRNELEKLEEAMEKLEPLSRMVSYWPSEAVAKFTQMETSFEKQGIPLQLSTSMDLSSCRFG